MYYARLTTAAQRIGDKLNSNVNSGIHYVMGNRAVMNYSEPHARDLFGDETDTVTVMRKPWGIFEVAVSTARQGNQATVRSALITALPDEIGKAALYVPDNNAPLYLVGNTIIKGTAYLSERKLSTGYIDGQDYKGSKLMYGDMLKSEPLLPPLDTTAIHELKLLLNEQPAGYRLNVLERFPYGSRHSFASPQTNYYYSEQSIDIDGTMAGNIIIHSAMKIRVTAQASLEHVLLLAPVIDIDKGFKGSMQCVATRLITVGAESHLMYPSTLSLVGADEDSLIRIDHEAVVEGVVIIPGYDQTLGSRGTLKMEKGALLHGMAYINGAADIQGTVWGHVMTRTVQSKAGSTVYGNHMLNAIIDGTKRSAYMPATLWWGNSKEMVVAKWLE